jgi:hypothetical protein
MDKYAKKKKSDKVHLKEEIPMRKSSRARHSTAVNGNFCNYTGMASESIYYENDKDFDRMLFTDDSEFLMSMVNDKRGAKRKRKAKQKEMSSSSHTSG